MKEFWWKMPILRRLSPLRRGFVEAVWVIFLAAAIAGYGINQLFPDPATVSEPFALIGATLLVAFAVQTGWIVQTSRKRGPDRENWIGLTTGISSSALIGILIALCLSAHREPLGLIESFGFAWVVVSIGFMGLWTALQPWTVYDLNHAFNTEYPDD